MKQKKSNLPVNSDIKIEDLVGKNREYYKPIFEKFDSEGKSKELNVYALVFGPFWYIYRKMTFLGVFIIALQLIMCTLAASLDNIIFTLGVVATFLLYLKAGYYGNYDYYKRLKQVRDESGTIPEKHRERFINDKSGVDMFITICWVVASIIMFIYAVFM